MVSPLTTGTVTASLTVLVDNLDAHHTRETPTGVAIDQPTIGQHIDSVHAAVVDEPIPVAA